MPPPIILDHLATALVSGADAGDFLQAQLSADLAPLPESGGVLSAYCNPAGQVIAVLLAIRRGDGFTLVAGRALMDTLLSRLRKFVLRAKVELEAAGDTVLGLAQARTGGALASVSSGTRSANYGLPSTAENRQAGRDQEALIRWKRHELRMGLAWLDPATSEAFLPQMLGLDALGAVSFTKGCFPGQEVIARARYLGKVKRRPLCLEIDERVQVKPGDGLDLLGEAGEKHDAVLIDAAGSEGEGTTLLVVSRMPAADTPEALEIGGRRCALRPAAQG